MRLPGASRLVRSASLAVVTAILLGAAVGASNGAEADSAPAIHVPGPAIGDRGTYSLALDDSYEAGPDGTQQAFPFLSFEWQPGGQVRAADGLLHEADRVATSGWQYDGGAAAMKRLKEQSKYLAGIPDRPVWTRHNESLLLERGGVQVLAVDGSMHDVDYANGTLPTSKVTLGVGPQIYHHREEWKGVDRLFFDPLPTCLLVGAFQNMTLAQGDTLEGLGVCDLHGALLSIPSGAYKAAAWETVGGVPALRMDPTRTGVAMDGPTGFHFGGGRVTYWFANGIPYPVRMAWTSPGQPVTSVLELTGFQAGTTPRGEASILSGEAPAIAAAPPHPWGMDESGVTHPFPMSQAFRGARDAADYSGLRDYLKAHPDAYVGAAGYAQLSMDDGLHHYWSFTVTDGDTWLSVTADRLQGTPSVVPVGLPIAVPAATQANTTYSGTAVREADSPGERTYPLPADAPTLLPTAASLLGRWQAFASPAYNQQAGNAWAFRVSCDHSDDGKDDSCHDFRVSGWAGHVDTAYTPDQLDQSTTPPTLRSSGSGHISLLYFYDNLTLAQRESTLSVEESQGVAPPPSLAEAAGATPPAPVRPATLASFVPTPQQTAGVAAAAITVGVLYYLFPLAKGALGLFSRLKQPEILNHPARQQLLQLVEAQPGIHFKEMARRTGLPNGSLVHHLETLRRSGQVVARPSGGYTLYFLGAHVPVGSAEAASAQKADGARKILEAVRSQPGLSSADVAARTGLQPSTVTYHVQRLQAAGLLTGLRDGRAVRLHPVETGVTAT